MLFAAETRACLSYPLVQLMSHPHHSWSARQQWLWMQLERECQLAGEALLCYSKAETPALCLEAHFNFLAEWILGYEPFSMAQNSFIMRQR